MNSPSFEESIRGSEDPCLCDTGVGVVLRRYRKPSGLQQHCPGTAVPMVIVVALQEHRWRHFDPMQHLDHLGLENIGVGCLTQESFYPV
jgi:hypothetical protein